MNIQYFDFIDYKGFEIEIGKNLFGKFGFKAFDHEEKMIAGACIRKSKEECVADAKNMIDKFLKETK